MNPQESRAIQREAAKRDMVNCQQALTDFGPHLSGGAANFVEQLREALDFEASLDEPVTGEWWDSQFGTMAEFPICGNRAIVASWDYAEDSLDEVVDIYLVDFESKQSQNIATNPSRRRVYAILEAFDVVIETKSKE